MVSKQIEQTILARPCNYLSFSLVKGGRAMPLPQKRKLSVSAFKVIGRNDNTVGGENGRGHSASVQPSYLSPCALLMSVRS
jgi:hypothetical protein